MRLPDSVVSLGPSLLISDRV
ncbi:hypothetical protein EMIT0194P_30069 [Pseudomonas serbica]